MLIPGSGDPDAERLALESSARRRLDRSEFHKVVQRYAVLLFAVAIAIYFGWLSLLVFDGVNVEVLKDNEMVAALAVSPIAGTTFIVVFMLIGAFREYKPNDLNRLPVETVTRAAVGDESP